MTLSGNTISLSFTRSSHQITTVIDEYFDLFAALLEMWNFPLDERDCAISICKSPNMTNVPSRVLFSRLCGEACLYQATAISLHYFLDMVPMLIFDSRQNTHCCNKPISSIIARNFYPLYSMFSWRMNGASVESQSTLLIDVVEESCSTAAHHLQQRTSSLQSSFKLPLE
jgi:hypothetical protein